MLQNRIFVWKTKQEWSFFGGGMYVSAPADPSPPSTSNFIPELPRSRMCHSGLHGYSNLFRFCVDIRSYHDNCFLLFPPSKPLHIFMHSCASCSVVAVINALRIDCISGSESVHFACQFRRCFLTDARKRYHGRDKDRNYNLMEKVGTWENMGSHSDHFN